MTAGAMLSIVRRGDTYQVHYVASHPDDQVRPPSPCPNEDTLVTWLHRSGVNAGAIQQAVLIARSGGVAVLPMGGSAVQGKRAEQGRPAQ